MAKRAKKEELRALYDVLKSITSTLNLDEVLSLITQETSKIIDAEVSSLRLLTPGGMLLNLRASYGLEVEAGDDKEMELEKSLAEEVFRRRGPYIVRDLTQVDFHLPRFVKKKGLLSFISVPLIYKGDITGALTTYSSKKGHFSRNDGEFLSILASQAAIAIENARLFEQTRINYLNIIKALAEVIDAKDSYTRGHSGRVVEYATQIAEELGLSNKEKQLIQYASFLHDIGKIGVDIRILKKPSKLTPSEWRYIYRHPKIGARIVSQSALLKDLVPIILHHHERYDGGGYPDSNMKGEKIPLGARILAVADAYEAMVSDRPYRKALSQEEAKEELKKNAGTQFDPQVVEAFLRALIKQQSA